MSVPRFRHKTVMSEQFHIIQWCTMKYPIFIYMYKYACNLCLGRPVENLQNDRTVTYKIAVMFIGRSVLAGINRLVLQLMHSEIRLHLSDKQSNSRTVNTT